MPDYKFKGDYIVTEGKIETQLSLISFKEDDINIIYSPALDITGYGNTEEEAKNSFNIAMEEFLRYTINKKTFISEMKRLGWKISKSKRESRFTQPYFDHLLRDREYLKDIVRDKEFTKINQNVNLPAIA